MDNTKPYTKAPKPEIGRGCTFYYAPEGVAAKPCEGCYKLHETAWLEQYPPHTPTDIFEVRFKNTRRSYYQNVNNLPLERGDIFAGTRHRHRFPDGRHGSPPDAPRGF